MLSKHILTFSLGSFLEKRFEKTDKPLNRNLDPMQVMHNEAELISRASKTPANDGRPLRIHTAGEVSGPDGARALSDACEKWEGVVWTFTHRWETVQRSDWGSVSALASLENPQDARKAIRRGYAPACVFAELPGPKAFKLAGINWIPCPYEAHPSRPTCVQCGLCFDADRLRQAGKGVAFQVHGRDKAKMTTP